MFEIYSMSGIRFFGSCQTFCKAKEKIEELRKKGELLALNHSVLIYEVISMNPPKAYIHQAKYIKGKWKIDKGTNEITITQNKD